MTPAPATILPATTVPAASVPAAATPAPPPVIPALRQDLELISGAPDVAGAPRWLIYDPAQHKFFAIGRGSYLLLQSWRPGATIDQLAQDMWERHSETITPSEIASFIAFLQSSRLTLEAPNGGWRALAASAAAHRTSFASHLLHTYLFFRIPLIRPERMLAATLPLVRWLATGWFAAVIVLVAATGLYLVSREWDEFRATFAGVATIEGAVLLGVALMVVKLVHELGHAYVATAHGCRVPVLGVAFILGTPLLYCDVTDAWRLKSRRARLQVDTAGILADLAVASVATLVWAFLPPGGVRHFVFSLATAGWVLSLTMNLNPFMKFDGYHIASDWIGIENMQTRAMAMGRWYLRELLFGLGVAPPERFPARVTTGLVAYAWGLWLYRLVVFTGIALVVYGFFFKLAGIVLFAVEIGYFVIAPIVREILEWWTMRRSIVASRRVLVTGALFAAGIVAIAMPLSSKVHIPAVLEAEHVARLYPSLAAKVREVRVAHGDKVEAGATLVALDSSDLMQELELNRLRAQVVSLRLDRGTSDSSDREQAVVLENERASLVQQREGLQRQIRELDITAPFAGQVVEMLPSLQVDRALGPHDAVLVVRGETGGKVRGALDERDLWRIQDGAKATFVPDDLNLPALPVRVRSISRAAMATLDQVELAGSHGGWVADRPDAHRQPVPVTAQYGVRGAVAGDIPPAFLQRSTAGVLVADGAPESALSRAWRQVLKVLVRESGL